MKKFLLFLALFVSMPCWAGRSFNGTSDTLLFTSVSTVLDVNSGPETISLWVYPTNFGSAEQDMISAWNGSGEFVVGFGMCGGAVSTFTKIGYAIGNCAGLNPAQAQCSSVITANHWYHIVLLIDTANKYYTSNIVMAIVGNGIACTPFTNGHSRAATNLAIGSSSTGSNKFSGIIAEVAIWNDILSSGESSSLHTLCPLAVRPEAIVGYYPMYGGSGSSIEPDLSGHFINGTLTGTTPTIHPPCKPLLNF